ncbi:hypothetical protein WCD74_29750 [Actinomycetospora sp. OC33-EN08]|uniref:Uncharacterized protein n=1 Tax=Actinomycetospora aurantiaca TaxID=3129233 RepID=A0ABU8MXG6_9PSEU
MARRLPVDHYVVSIAATSQGFNEWRANIVFHTTEQGTIADVRFVDDPSSPDLLPEDIQETGPSLSYLPYSSFYDVLRAVRTDDLSIVLYDDDDRLLIDPGR